MKDSIKGIYTLFCIVIIVMFLLMPDNGNKKSDATYDGRESLKQQLRDPDSLQIIQENIVDGHYTAHYRAKNGFGGYVEENYVSPQKAY